MVRSMVVVLGAKKVGIVGNDGKCSGTGELRDGKWGSGLLMLRGGGFVAMARLAKFKLRCISALIYVICCIICEISPLWSLGSLTATSVKPVSSISLCSAILLFPLFEARTGKASMTAFDQVK